MSKKKIIILYSTGGMGHKKAAMAVLRSFQDKGEDLNIEIIDVLDYANRFYQFVYKDLYVYFMSQGKLIWGALYHFSNNSIFDAITRKLREIIDSRSLPGLCDHLIKQNPDAIITTHFLLPSIAGVLKKHKGFHSRLYTVMTDYGPHKYWLSKYIDRIFAGSEFVREELLKHNVTKEKITVTGIPTEREFCEEFDVVRLKAKYRLDKDKKTIFLMSGGFGVGPMEKILLSLNSCSADIQVITVCGHNKEVYEDVNKLISELKYPVLLYGFTDKVAEMMAVSDVMITKAGGISVTEALNIRLPMVLYASIPGQETWNEIFLTSSRAAEKADDIKDIPVIVNRILLSQDAYDAAKDAIEKIRRPDAAERIADRVLEDIK